ncbi:MAG: hypothetical protein D5S00_07245 [Tindallia sp. MSAO_Bac2]|nr:MAG: hypothetical protein D5S00_07245 [Tindallia sp. MSAO_Bac2]
MNVNSHAIYFPVPLPALDGLPDLVNDNLDPFAPDGYRQEELLQCCQQIINILLAIQAFVKHQVQPGKLQMAEGL